MGTQPPVVTQAVVYARAVSIFNSRTFWLNTVAFGIAVLVLPQIADIVPERYVTIYSALVAIANVYLRMTTVRPVALIAPGEVKVVEIPKINPPATGLTG